jgi:hypothetical protein
MSIMNMPPLPYVKRIPGLDYEVLKLAYSDASVWDAFEPGLLTLCSPDPQAIRPPDEKVNVLQVTLPTNFKVAMFDDRHTSILRQIETEIEAVRLDAPEGKIELPVKLKVHNLIFLLPIERCIAIRQGLHEAYERILLCVRQAQTSNPARVHVGG